MKVEQSTAKRAVLEKLLEHGMVLVTLDTRVEGVSVPDHLRGDAQLRLNLSYRFGLPMETNEHEVAATLTFSGVPYECHLPWDSIYMLVSHVTGQPYLFPADMPADADPLGTAAAAAKAPARPKTGPPQLKVVSSPERDVPSAAREPGVRDASGPRAAPEREPSDDDPPPPSTRRGHLRVVK